MSNNSNTKITGSNSGSVKRPSRQREPLSKPIALQILASALKEVNAAGFVITWRNNNDAEALVLTICGAKFEVMEDKTRFVPRQPQSASIPVSTPDTAEAAHEQTAECHTTGAE